jgi:hypothetical protein
MPRIPVTAALIVFALVYLNFTPAEAGPCSSDIAQFEAAIRASKDNPFAGLMARQSVNAQLEHQPTPESVQQANERLKSQFSATMARAKRLDARGDRTGCKGALDAAKNMYIF